MPKKRKTEFNVDEFLKANVPDDEDIKENTETVIIDTKEVEEQEEVDFSQPRNRVAAAFITEEPKEDGDWQTEQEVELGQYKADRIRTERQKEVERIKELQVENRGQIKNMMTGIHGEEAQEIKKDENEKTLSKKSLLAAQEKQRKEEAEDINIVDQMMGELLTNYRPKDK